MERTLYEICEEVLAYVTESIINTYGNKIEQISLELIKFLTTNNSRYEEIFNQFTSFEFAEDKTQYKRVMMLIIASSSYYFALYSIRNDMCTDINKNIIEDMENMNYKNVINMFYNWGKNSKIIDYIEDYCDFYMRNYIFRNNCMEEVIKQNKIYFISKINPFEIINYLDYLDPSMFLESEKMIQKFIDTYDTSLCYCRLDEFNEQNNYDSFNDFVADIIREKVEEEFVTEEKIKQFYSYIISNVYEGFIIYYHTDKLLIKKYPLIGKEFLKDDIDFNYLYEKILNDNEFLLKIVDFFIEINDDIYEDDLMSRRLDFKQIGDLTVLKKLDPFYEEEEIMYAKILEKRYPN